MSPAQSWTFTVRKSVLWPLLVILLVAGATILSHGVILPKSMWEHRLALLNQEFPETTATADRVVLALGSQPELLISGFEQHNTTTGEQLNIALLRVRLADYGLVQGETPRITGLTIKGMASIVPTHKACNEAPMACVPKLLLEWVLHWTGEHAEHRFTGWQNPVWNLDNLTIEKAHWETTGHTLLKAELDDFRYRSGSRDEPNQLALAWRFSNPGGDRAYVALQASPSRYESAEGPVTWSLKNLHTEFNGQWQGYPWTGTLAQQQLLLSLAQAGEHNTGAPVVRVGGQQLRIYLRRDDDPDTHQAAFSAGDYTGGLPMQRWSFRQAEWTFTHQDAQAWTFNLQFNPATQRLQIEPASIEGSEGLPAPAHVRGPDCSQLAVAKSMRPDSTAVWQWQQSWFHIGDDAEVQTKAANSQAPSFRLCLQPTL